TDRDAHGPARGIGIRPRGPRRADRHAHGPARGIGSRPRRALGTDPGAHPDGAGPPVPAPERAMKRTIAVDLTPVLPGGDNGGAKIFVLELLRTLAAMRPDHEFVLLTQAASHDELAHLDRPN